MGYLGLLGAPIWEFPKNRDTLVWVPYIKDPTIWGAIFGSPIFGNSHLGALRPKYTPQRIRIYTLKGFGTLKPYHNLDPWGTSTPEREQLHPLSATHTYTTSTFSILSRDASRHLIRFRV